MARWKEFKDNETVIDAAFLNGIQDRIINDEGTLAGKVDKVTGKGLSTKDYTAEDQTKLSNLPTGAALTESLNGKVPTTRKVNGKDLSADITLTPEDIEYSESTAYSDGKIGKKISELSRRSDMTGVDEWYDADLWEIGHILSLSGLDSDSPTYNRMRTKTFIPKNVSQIVTGTGYGVYLYCYDQDGTYLGIWNGTAPVKSWVNYWLTGTVDIKAVSDIYRFRLLASRTNDAEPQLTPADNAQMFRFVSFTDESLSTTGKAADAKVTGDRLNALGIYDTTSGDMAIFDDGADGVPMRSLVATIEPVQAGTGDPAPDNIRPISGHTGLTAKRTGKNLYAPPAASVISNGVTLTSNADGSVTLSGQANSAAAIFFSPVDIPSGTTVTIGLNNTAADANVGVRVISTTDGGTDTQWGTSVLADAVNKKLTFTTSFAVKAINVFVKANHGAVNITLKIMVELGSTSGAFEPYAGTDISVAFPTDAGNNGTIYGGGMDVVSGVLTVDRELFYLDGSTTISAITQMTNVIRFWIYTNQKFYLPTPYASKIRSDRLTLISFSQDVPGFTTSAEYPQTIVVKLPNGTCEATAAGIKAYLQANPLPFVLPLASPVTYQLTPQEVTTLLGHNVVQTDAGPVSVTAARDGRLYIEGKIAELQALILENS